MIEIRNYILVCIMKNNVKIVLIKMAWLESDGYLYLWFSFLLPIPKSDSSTF